MRVFITGGSGFVGGHIIEKLASEHEFSALARSARSAEQVRAYGAQPVRGELGEVDPAVLHGVDAVVHCAARVEDFGTRDQFWRTNVEGTRQLLRATKEAGVPRFVHLGTEAVLFVGEDLVDVDESHPYPHQHRFSYGESKQAAERVVVAANDDDLTTISLRPRLVWGPRDQTVLPVLVEMVRTGRFAWIDHGRARTSTTHVANVVHAVGLALTQGRGGQAYFVSDDETSTHHEFMTRLLATQGLEPGTRSLPGWAARGVATVVEAAWHRVAPEKRPPLTRLAVEMMARTVTVRIDKARRELGYAPVVSVSAGMAELAELAAQGRARGAA